MKQLDWKQKHQVTYCVPTWLRDDQIRLATARVKERIQPYYEKRIESVAVVGFGPSLNESWEQVKNFQYIITCSGSHKFLLEKGIVPTWHVEVDPRSHKVALLGPPHKDVEYLVASACHPAYFDHLQGFNLKLWHVFDATEDGRRLLPPGEWAITGGCDVGLRALTIAAFLGFRDLHVFGIDGCARGDMRHAAQHPNGKQPFAETEYKGVKYLTTAAMLEAAKQTLHELKQMPAVKVKFYGEGLTQALVADYVPSDEATKPLANIVGFSKPELISSEYRDLNAKLHQENPYYGVSAERHIPTVLKLAESLKTKNILDYGCGKGLLGRGIPWQIAEYDPCILGKDEPPKPADIVCCIDVLEHIEPEKLPFVLDDLRRCVRQVGYFVIHMGPAQKLLGDGRNTHLIQQGKDWWRKRLAKFFEIGTIKEVGMELHCVVGPKRKVRAA